MSLCKWRSLAHLTPRATFSVLVSGAGTRASRNSNAVLNSIYRVFVEGRRGRDHFIWGGDGGCEAATVGEPSIVATVAISLAPSAAVLGSMWHLLDWRSASPDRMGANQMGNRRARRPSKEAMGQTSCSSSENLLLSPP